jgi:hypothetical protein
MGLFITPEAMAAMFGWPVALTVMIDYLFIQPEARGDVRTLLPTYGLDHLVTVMASPTSVCVLEVLCRMVWSATVRASAREQADVLLVANPESVRHVRSAVMFHQRCNAGRNLYRSMHRDVLSMYQ